MAQRVGLFGGSFNPPHICHLLASLYLLETTDLDAIWWLPVHRHAFAKGSALRSWEHRLALCEAVVADHPQLRIEPIERELGGTSHTLGTVLALRARHPQIELSWVIGCDLLAELPSWHRWDELRELIAFTVLGRGSLPSPADLPAGGRFVLRDFALPDVSSSLVRSRLARGEDVQALVPAAVCRYLEQHPELYS